jgi:succinyl-diaminopimelate desuccinylase
MPTPSSAELTQQLVRFNTINPPGEESACAEYLGALLERAGFSLAYHSFAPGRVSLIARIGGARERLPLGFTGHLDVVPLGAAAWSREPFAGETDGDRLYGRGSSDMKAGIAAFVHAAIELAPRLRSSAGLVLILTAGEETGCQGAAALADTPGALPEIGALLVGEPTANYPTLGHKGAFWLRAICRGRTAHGSMPERGDNAVYKAARAALALQAFKFNVAPHTLMGEPSLNLGCLHGGLNINSVPDRAELNIDIRTTPPTDHVALFEQLQALLGSEVELERMLDIGSVYTEPDDPWIASACAIAGGLLGEAIAPRSMTYFTDAAPLRRAYGPRLPVLLLGPGSAPLAHQTDEYCSLNHVDLGTEMYRRIIQDWCSV